jgi:hypothetical protein
LAQTNSVDFSDLVDVTPSSDGSVDASELVEARSPQASGPQAPKPLAYLTAGVGKAATLLPSMAGMIGTGFETIGDLAFPKEPITLKKIKDTYIEAGKEGFDKTLVDFGFDLTKGMTDFLGIDPVARHPMNQIMDIVGTYGIPVPAGFLGGAAAKGLKGAAGKTATFLSPAVRMGPKGNRLSKQFGLRMGTSLGVGGGIEQGFRALMDSPHAPLMFSEEAITGFPAGSVAASELVDVGDVPPDAVEASTLIDDIPPNIAEADYFDPIKAARHQAQEDAEDTENWKDYAIWVGTALFATLGLKYRNALIKSRTPVAPFGTAPTPGKSDLRDAWAIASSRDTIKEQAQKGAELAKNRARLLYGAQADSNYVLIQQAKAAGVPEHLIEQLRGQGGVHTADQIMQIFKFGKFPDGQQASIPLRALKQQYDRWEVPRQEEFISYIAAVNEDIVRTKATALDFLSRPFDDLLPLEKRAFLRIRNAVRGMTLGRLEDRMDIYRDIVRAVRGTRARKKPGLWKDDGSPTSDNELFATIRKGQADTEFELVRKQMAEYAEIILRDSVKRNVQGKAWAEQTIRNFTRNGEVVYLPSQQANEVPALWRRMGASMGFPTTAGKTMNTVGFLQKKALEEFEGIASPMNPFQSLGTYVSEMLDHTNRSVIQMNWMKYLLDMDFDGAGFAVFKSADDEAARAIRAAREKEFFTDLPTYIGRISPTDPDNSFSMLNLKFLDDAAETRWRKISDLRASLGDQDPGVAQMAMQQIALVKDALVIQYKGDFHLFGLNPLVKNALEFDDSLMNGIGKFNLFFKRLLTMNTVGRYSTFGPTSFVYNASIGSLNTFLHNKGGLMEAGVEAIQVWRDAVKGTVDIMVTDIADDFVQLITHTLETNIGIGSSNPAILRAMQAKLQARVKRSLIHDFRRRTGTVGASGQSVDEFVGGISGAMGKAAPYIYKTYGANVMPQFVKIWDNINAGLHEGTAFGMTLRRLEGTTIDKTANQLRIAKRQVAELVGNNKLRGASEVARQANAAVPFYGATIQGFSTLGRAFKAARLALPAKLTIAVGIPMAIEVAYNSISMGDEKYEDAAGRMWTHNEWYWKGLTAGQRANNVYAPKPGQPPWNAWTQSVIPEIAAIRGIYLDVLETVFGLSDEGRFSWDHTAVTFGRAWNVPLPPLLKAAASAIGVDVRVGLTAEGDDDLTSIPVQQRSLPAPNRQTPNQEQARYEGGEVSVRFQAIVQDLGGTLATIGLKVFNSFNSGDEDTPIKQKVQAGFDQLGKSVLESARYAGGLFDVKVHRSREDPEVASQVFAKESALKHWATVEKTQETGGTMSGGFPKQGRTSTISQDPVTQGLAADAAAIIQSVLPFKTEISNLNKQVNSLQHSLYNDFDSGIVPRGPITIVQRDLLIDAYKNQIGMYREIILMEYKAAEQSFFHIMGENVGEDLSHHTFESWKDRANPRSASPGLPKLPQTSQ